MLKRIYKTGAIFSLGYLSAEVIFNKNVDKALMEHPEYVEFSDNQRNAVKALAVGIGAAFWPFAWGGGFVKSYQKR